MKMVCNQMAKRASNQMKQNSLISSLLKQGSRSKRGWLWCNSTTTACTNKVIHLPLSRQSFSWYHSSSFIKQIKDSDKEGDPSINGPSDDSSRDWIPPQRPLSGDLGKSELYATKMKPKEITSSPLQLASTGEESMFLKAIQEEHAEDNETAEFIDLDDLDIEAFRKIGSESADGNKNTSFINLEDLEIEGFREYVEDQNERGFADDDQDDLDYDSLFENDEVLSQLISDSEFETDDEELLSLQMEMIDDRLNEIKEEMKQKNQSQKENEKKEEESQERGTFDFITEDNSELDEFLKEQNSKTEGSTSNTAAPDWLSTRRSRLSPTDLLTPEESSRAQQLDSEIPIIKDTLLSSNEIMTCLKNLGAIDVEHITPDEQTSPYFGWEGLIIATGTSYSHIRVLTDSIVKNLRKRNLAKKGIIGALYGAEGGEDNTSSRRRRGLPKKVDDGWIAVDCGNFIVHVQDDLTRESIDLAGLWSPGERGRSGQELRKLDFGDEDAVDDYVAQNPVPDKYAESLFELSGDFWGDGQMRGGLGNREKVKSGRWTPNSNRNRKMKNRVRW